MACGEILCFFEFGSLPFASRMSQCRATPILIHGDGRLRGFRPTLDVLVRVAPYSLRCVSFVFLKCSQQHLTYAGFVGKFRVHRVSLGKKMYGFTRRFLAYSPLASSRPSYFSRAHREKENGAYESIFRQFIVDLPSALPYSQRLVIFALPKIQKFQRQLSLSGNCYTIQYFVQIHRHTVEYSEDIVDSPRGGG